jgi:hypothetical protein
LVTFLVAMLDLDGDMANLEIFLKLVTDMMETFTILRRLRRDEVNCQSIFRGAHTPNMQILDGLDSL